MRILFVADGRSPTALGWIEHFSANTNYEVHLASSFACEPPLKLASLHIVAVAFSDTARGASRSMRAGIPAGLRTALRNWIGPFTLPAAGRSLAGLIDAIKPDLVHAMRIPYEGMLAAAAEHKVPLLVSVWGNDFTLHARSNPFMAAATRRALYQADGLHTDTQRDKRLAKKWGFDTNKPALVLPGNGGVRSEIFHPAKEPSTEPRVINPRGMRAYVRNDTFFKAIPLVLEKKPNTKFLCPAMLGEPEAEGWVRKLGLNAQVELMPKLSASELAQAYQQASVMVSPSTHDGTPNSLLEAMACGVFPVCGDLESIREWIRDGENGLLVEPESPRALAEATLRALNDGQLRAQAAEANQRLVSQRADYNRNMLRVERFYQSLA